MPRHAWPLAAGLPRIEIVLTPANGSRIVRQLLADTGAGSQTASFELILEPSDCLLCAGRSMGTVRMRGAFRGRYRLFSVRVEIPQVGFVTDVAAVGAIGGNSPLDGIAGFRFLNRFTYGNFGIPAQFGLEV